MNIRVMKKTDQRGQLILTLILVMTVALVIGLSVIQRSLVDVSTSTKVEQSSRAFSAAEAGIEQALLNENSATSRSLALDNNSRVEISNSGRIPQVPAAGTRQSPLEYPPVVKEEIAQVWLADPLSVDLAVDGKFYNQSEIEVYWGNLDSDVPALELTFVYYDGVQYKAVKHYFDSPSVTRTPANNFETNGVECRSSVVSYYVVGAGQYKCKVVAQVRDESPTSVPILGRIRLLYNTQAQPLAFWADPAGASKCGRDCSLPPQARRIVSTGKSGESQRRVRLFQLDKVVPPYFDFAIFSVGEIKK